MTQKINRKTGQIILESSIVIMLALCASALAHFSIKAQAISLAGSACLFLLYMLGLRKIPGEQSSIAKVKPLNGLATKGETSLWVSGRHTKPVTTQQESAFNQLIFCLQYHPIHIDAACQFLTADQAFHKIASLAHFLDTKKSDFLFLLEPSVANAAALILEDSSFAPHTRNNLLPDIHKIVNNVRTALQEQAHQPKSNATYKLIDDLTQTALSKILSRYSSFEIAFMCLVFNENITKKILGTLPKQTLFSVQYLIDDYTNQDYDRKAFVQARKLANQIILDIRQLYYQSI